MNGRVYDYIDNKTFYPTSIFTNDTTCCSWHKYTLTTIWARTKYSSFTTKKFLSCKPLITFILNKWCNEHINGRNTMTQRMVGNFDIKIYLQENSWHWIRNGIRKLTNHHVKWHHEWHHKVRYNFSFFGTTSHHLTFTWSSPINLKWCGSLMKAVWQSSVKKFTIINIVCVTSETKDQQVTNSFNCLPKFPGQAIE